MQRKQGQKTELAKVENTENPQQQQSTKLTKWEQTELKGIWTRTEGCPTLQRRPKAQQRRQSRTPHDKKGEKQRNISIASWNLTGLKIKDASEFLTHTQVEMPRDIICKKFSAKQTNWVVAQTMSFLTLQRC